MLQTLRAEHFIVLWTFCKWQHINSNGIFSVAYSASCEESYPEIMSRFSNIHGIFLEFALADRCILATLAQPVVSNHQWLAMCHNVPQCATATLKSFEIDPIIYMCIPLHCIFFTKCCWVLHGHGVFNNRWRTWMGWGSMFLTGESFSWSLWLWSRMPRRPLAAVLLSLVTFENYSRSTDGDAWWIWWAAQWCSPLSDDARLLASFFTKMASCNGKFKAGWGRLAIPNPPIFIIWLKSPASTYQCGMAKEWTFHKCSLRFWSWSTWRPRWNQCRG